MKETLLFICILFSFLGFSFSTTVMIPFSVDDGAIYDPRGFIYAFSGKSMMILDVSNPSWVNSRTFELEKYYESGVVCGGKLYIYGERNLFIYDMRKPFHPKLLRKIDRIYGVSALACAKGMVYAIGDEYMRVIRGAEIVKTIREVHGGAVVNNRWWISGNYLFVQRKGGGFVVIDISEKLSPKVVRIFKSYGKSTGQGRWAYSVGMSDFLAIDVSDPKSPMVVNVIDMQKICGETFQKGNVTSYPVIRGVELVGNYLVVVYTWDEDWLALLSLKDPSNPRLVRREKIINEGDFTNITLTDGGRYLYIFHFDRKLTIYRVEAKEIAELEFPQSPCSALVAFVGGGDGWLKVVGDAKVYLNGEYVKRLQEGQSTEVSGRVIGVSLNLSDETTRYYYFYLPEDKSCLIKIHGASDKPQRIVEYECKSLK